MDSLLHNAVVNRVRAQIGPFNYADLENNPEDKELEIHLPEGAELINHSPIRIKKSKNQGPSYFGEWAVKGTKKLFKAGRGMQIWPDGSVYEG